MDVIIFPIGLFLKLDLFMKTLRNSFVMKGASLARTYFLLIGEMYIREDIPSKLLYSKSKTSIETIFVEINIRKRKCLLNCSCNSDKNLFSNHLVCLNRIEVVLLVLPVLQEVFTELVQLTD